MAVCVALAAGCGSSSSQGGGTSASGTITLRVPSAAMEPTLRLGSMVTVSIRPNYVPRLGDIVAFHPPTGATSTPPACGNPHQGAGQSRACAVPTRGESSQVYIKRIVGGPGDRLSIADGHVILNGRRVPDSSYTTPCAGGSPICNFPSPIRVPRGAYFVLGDNRGESADSRFWGPVPRSYIIGQVQR